MNSGWKLSAVTLDFDVCVLGVQGNNKKDVFAAIIAQIL